MNYRQYYKEYYNIDFGKEYAIHHIDQNRDNNNIHNLILLPRTLHSRFHMNFALDHYEISNIREQMFDYNAYNLQDFYKWLKKVTEQYNELFRWIRYKGNLDECIYWDGVVSDRIEHPEGIVSRDWRREHIQSISKTSLERS